MWAIALKYDHATRQSGVSEEGGGVQRLKKIAKLRKNFSTMRTLPPLIYLTETIVERLCHDCHEPPLLTRIASLMSLIPKPQTVNRFPGCVAMKLHIELESAPTPGTAPNSDPSAPSPPDTGNGHRPDTRLVMSLTINFSGEQSIDIPGARVLGIPSGKATFGVRRCELRFSLQGCRLPLDQVTLSAPFKRSVTVETQREQTTEAQAGVTLGGTVGEKPSGTGSGTLGWKQGDKTTEKVTTERWQIHYTGDETAPMWVFEVKGGDKFLEGALTREPLGTVSLSPLAEPPQPVSAPTAVKQPEGEPNPSVAPATSERPQLEAPAAL